jgi:hypothetical protein
MTNTCGQDLAARPTRRLLESSEPGRFAPSVKRAAGGCMNVVKERIRSLEIAASGTKRLILVHQFQSVQLLSTPDRSGGPAGTARATAAARRSAIIMDPRDQTPESDHVTTRYPTRSISAWTILQSWNPKRSSENQRTQRRLRTQSYLSDRRGAAASQLDR